MLAKPDSCASCPLGNAPIGKKWGFVPPSGLGANGVLVVGDFAGKEEEGTGESGSGPASRQFNRLLSRAGYPRDQFRFANVLSCRPPEGKLAGEWFENRAVESCRIHLDTEISQQQPKVMLALGDIAMRRLTGVSGIMRYRGRPLEGPNGTWVVPTLAPSSLLPRQEGGVRNPARFTGAVILDIKKAFHIKDHGFSRSDGNYLLDPSPEEFLKFILEYEGELAREAFTLLSWDIETLYKLKNQDEGEIALRDAEERGIEEGAILRISFAFRPGYAATVPWTPSYMEGIKRLLASPGPKVTWNGWHFDEPKLRAEGLAINGESHDGMWAWHLYQPDLDMGLEFVSSFATDLLPWKHLNSAQPELYSAIDPDAALQNVLYIFDKLKKHNQWDLYMRHVVQMAPIWRAAGEAGVHIDIPKQNALKEELDRELAGLAKDAQDLVPQELKPKLRYKTKRVVEAGIAEGRTFIETTATGKIKVCSVCKAEGITKGAHFKGGKKNPCKVAGGVVETHLGKVTQWDEILDFNPNSSDQVKNYIRFFKHPMGRDPKDRSKQQVNAKHLKKLIKEVGDEHPLYKLVLDYHRRSKTRSTYCPPPDETGRIYTQYTDTPATWRTSSRAPSIHGTNVQNWGKREDNPWAKRARGTLIAKPGHVFVSADSKAVEALFTGWFMRDLNFMKLSAKGVYSWLQCVQHGVEFNEENAARLKKSDDKGYRRKKQTTLGTLYGMDAPMLAETYPDDFANQAEAKGEQDFLFTALPALREFQTATRVRAHKETFLVSPWGYRRYFYDVYVNTRNRWGVWVTKEGQGADKAVAQLPQNSNTAFQRDNILLLDQTWLKPYKPATLFVHDSLTYEVPEERALEAAELLEQVMTRPIPEMNNLRCGIEIEIGKNGGDYDKEKNPEGMRLHKAVLIEPTEAMLPNYDSQQPKAA